MLTTSYLRVKWKQLSMAFIVGIHIIESLLYEKWIQFMLCFVIYDIKLNNNRSKSLHSWTQRHPNGMSAIRVVFIVFGSFLPNNGWAHHSLYSRKSFETMWCVANSNTAPALTLLSVQSILILKHFIRYESISSPLLVSHLESPVFPLSVLVIWDQFRAQSSCTVYHCSHLPSNSYNSNRRITTNFVPDIYEIIPNNSLSNRGCPIGLSLRTNDYSMLSTNTSSYLMLRQISNNFYFHWNANTFITIKTFIKHRLELCYF